MALRGGDAVDVLRSQVALRVDQRALALDAARNLVRERAARRLPLLCRASEIRAEHRAQLVNKAWCRRRGQRAQQFGVGGGAGSDRCLS